MKYLTVSFPYSNDGFVQVFGGETVDCVCQGLKNIFEHIGGTPGLMIFDNVTGVGRRVGDHIHETELFHRFRAYYGCQVRFCNPYAGYENEMWNGKLNACDAAVLAERIVVFPLDTKPTPGPLLSIYDEAFLK